MKILGPALAPLLVIGVGVASSPSCQPAFPTAVVPRALQVQITGGAQTATGPGALDTVLGMDSARIPITFETPDVYTVSIQANDENGNVDTTFTGYVRLSIQPGNVLSVTGENTNGRNVELINGVLASDVQVSILGAYGDSRIWAQDLGYQPIDPDGVPLPDGGVRLPQCANGIDDNHNGLVDYPIDPGCYAPNDDSEDGGSYASASSQVIYFQYPRIADVEGVSNNGAGTPFPNEQVQINTEWNGLTTNTPKGVVVTGVASTGFFVTDIGETRGYASVYGYTYTAPTLMNVCDRFIAFGGTAAEFYGFLEINYPTWTLEQWDPVERPCLVPEPTPITIAQLQTTSSETLVLTPLEAGLVRVPAPDGSTIHIASMLGPGLIPYTTAANGTVSIAANAITPDVTSCDYEGTGKIDFENAAEAACEAACTNNVECSEYTQYASNSQFQLVVVNEAGTASVSITGDGASSAGFNPVQLRGQQLVAFTGNLTYFSGGSQFTIQARCADDIVMPGNPILPSSPSWPTPPGKQQERAACVVNLADQATTN